MSKVNASAKHPLPSMTFLGRSPNHMRTSSIPPFKSIGWQDFKIAKPNLMKMSNLLRERPRSETKRRVRITWAVKVSVWGQ